jgi:long-chain acyl-CoA synthetase
LGRKRNKEEGIKMEEEKTLTNVLRVVPDLVKMKKQREDLVKALIDNTLLGINQLGIRNIILILLSTIRKVGLSNSMKSLLNFRLGKLAPNFFISMMEVLGDKEAIISEDRKLTYKELKERVLRLANGLIKIGISSGDLVASMTYNTNEVVEVLFASSVIGFPVSLLNWHLNKEELLIFINRVKPKIIIFDKEFTDRIKSIKPQLKNVKHFIMIGKGAEERTIPYEDLISKSSDEIPKDVNFLLPLGFSTAGTTGVPKDMHVADAYSYAFSEMTSKVARPRTYFTEYLEYLIRLSLFFLSRLDLGEIRKIRLLMTVPYYHGAAWACYYPFLYGTTQILQKKFDPEGFLKIIEKERANYTVVVPTMLRRILELPDEIKGKYDLSSMHTLLCMSAPCIPELKKDTNKFFIQQGCKKPVFYESYASTEGATPTVLAPTDYMKEPKRIESVGKAGLTSDMVIFDEEKGEICPPNKEGVAYTRGIPSIAIYYRGLPKEETEKQFRVINRKDGWFREGVRAYLDENDFLYLTGREKEVIIPGGVNIYPDEIEKVILRYPKVADVAVIPIPDKDLGEVVGAIVQLKKEELATEEEIIEHCRKEGLYGYKVPQKIDFWKELPRDIDGGKMIKREILPKYWEEKGIKRRG